MLRELWRAVAMPFRRPGAAMLAGGCLIALPLLLVLAGRAASLWFGHGFFDPAGGGDPLLRQHVMWFAGAPETLAVFHGAGLMLLGPLALVIWWRGLGAVPPRGAVWRVAPWVVLGLVPYLLPGVVYAIWPAAPAGLDLTLALLSQLIVVALILFLRPRFAAALAAPPGAFSLPRIALLATLTLMVGGIAQLLGIAGWIGMSFAAEALRERGAAPGLVTLWIADWEGIAFLLAYAYTALVLATLLYAAPKLHRGAAR